MRRRVLSGVILALALAVLTSFGACQRDDNGRGVLPQTKVDGVSKEDASVQAVFLLFAFDAHLITNTSWNLESQIENQLLYTIGQLNGEKSVGRLDNVVLSAIKTESVDGGTKVSYHAKLLVAWGKRDSVPQNYSLILPRDTTYAGLERFTESYKGTCVELGAHDVDSNSMWYYYRPNRKDCALKDADVVRTSASVTVSEVSTTGKYPEYHKIWEDGVFRSVVIFGKFEDGATANSDSGIASYNSYIRETVAQLKAYNPTTVPADLPSEAGVANPDVTISATLPDGKRVEVVVLLVDNVRTAPQSFTNRYAAVSGKADFIAYNGHSGLGANIRALARKGHWETGQYVVIFINGCDTYAYVDSALADAHKAVNPDDTAGTKYLDMVMNAMPAPSYSSANNTLAIFKGLLAHDAPKTFEQIFVGIGKSQVVLVAGEQDNVYFPGYGENPVEPGEFTPMDESGTVLKDADVHYQTGVLKAGVYTFSLSGDGDADLYVRVGEAPNKDLYDCRPYRYGSKESCRVELTSPAEVFVMVRGWDPSSTYQLQSSAQ